MYLWLGSCIFSLRDERTKHEYQDILSSGNDPCRTHLEVDSKLMIACSTY